MKCQTQKDNIVQSHLHEVPGGVKFIEKRKHGRGWGLREGNGSECSMGTEFQFRKMKVSWQWMAGEHLHNNVCVLNDTKLYSQVKVVNFITYILPQFKKKKQPLMQHILKRVNFGNPLVVQ